MTDTTAQSLSRRYRLLALASLLAVAALAWAYLFVDPSMPEMSGGGPMPARTWDAQLFLLTFVMWSVMMVGMMLPSAAPATLLYASMARRAGPESALASAWIFTAGYLAVWTAFSLGATALQGILETSRLLTPRMTSPSALLSGGLLVVAGIYQWLPLKDACLRHCRSPLHFFMFRWRPNARGAFIMGAEHGLVCLGCCWALMLLLFVAGVMNLLWVALIAAFVFVEKLAPGGRWIRHGAGVGLTAAGVAVMVAGA